MNKCCVSKANGKPCEAHVRAGSAYCYFHDNQVAQQRRMAQSKGGSKRKTSQPLSPLAEDFDLASPQGLLASFQFTFNRIVRGEIDAKTAHAMAYLCECARKLYDTTVLKVEIERLKDLADTERVQNPLDEQLDEDFDQFEELPMEENTPNA